MGANGFRLDQIYIFGILSKPIYLVKQEAIIKREKNDRSVITLAPESETVGSNNL